MRRRWREMLLALASLAFVLGVLEVAARILRARQGAGREENTIAQYTEPDPRLGWRKRPGAHAVYRRREYTVDIDIDADGRRDRPRAVPPPGWRALALGDSFVEGYTVPSDQTVSRRMEDALGCGAEVVNAGTSGYSTDQEYLDYVDHGARLQPRVVLLFFYYNDVVFNDRDGYYGRPKPMLWPDESGALRIANEPVPLPIPRAPEPPRAAPRGSALLDLVEDRVQRGSPRAYQFLSRFGLWPPLTAEDPGPEMRVYATGPTPKIDAAWQRTGFIIAALRDQAAAHGARLLVIHVPNRFEVVDRDWELTERAYGMDDAHWSRTRVRDRLFDLCARLQVPTLDLTPALRASEKGMVGGPYLTYDPHWNATGHRVAADAVARWLRDEGWFACGR